MEFNQKEPVTEDVIESLKNASVATYCDGTSDLTAKKQREKAIKSLITFAKKAYDSYGEELEMNLRERATGNEYHEEMKKYEQGKEELFDIVYSITKE